MKKSHNPYFNRWFSAIRNRKVRRKNRSKVTILILIDGFLQFYIKEYDANNYLRQSQSLF